MMKYKTQATYLVFIFILTVSSLSYFALNKVRQSTAINITDTLQTILLTVQEAHHILVDQRKIAIEAIAKTAAIIELAEQLLADYEAGNRLAESQAQLTLRSVFGPILKEFSDQGFFIIAQDRVSIGSMRNINLGTTNLIELQQQSALKKAFRGETVFIPPIKSDVEIEPDAGQSATNTNIFVITPMRNELGKIFAVLAFRINPSIYFEKVTTIGRLGDTGETYVFDKRGTLLTESRFADQLHKLNLLNHGQRSSLNISIKDPGGDLIQGFKSAASQDSLPLTLMAKEATQGRSGYNVDGYRDYRGVTVFGAWLWDKEHNFGLATEIDADEALTNYIQTRNTFILVIGTTVFLSLFILRMLFSAHRHSEIRILKTNAELENRVSERTALLEQAKDDLTYALQELQVQATTDELTSLANRRQFDNMYSKEWQRCLRDKKSLAVILFDIDYFKQYNDLYGHQAGDMCLRQIGQFLQDAQLTRRPGDCIARYGGEEFILMLSDPSELYLQTVAKYLCEGISNLAIKHEGSGLSKHKIVTISAGYAIFDNLENIRQNQLIKHADQALYCAKESGRNRIYQYVSDKGENITDIHNPKTSNEL